jgi:hypothetical protein
VRLCRATTKTRPDALTQNVIACESRCPGIVEFPIHSIYHPSIQ